MGVYYVENTLALYFDDVNSEILGGKNAASRIGLTPPQVSINPGAVQMPEERSADGNRIGKQTLFGDYQDISYLEGYVQGKNIKNLTQFFKMNLPALRSNNCQYYKSQRLSGEIDHTLSITRDISLGQNDGVRRALSYNPFLDNLSKLFVPAEQIANSVRQGKPFSEIIGGEAYPIVTDSTVSFLNHNDPDALGASYNGGHFRDGAIEPLGIRNSFANPNTSNPNIQIRGIKGSFMPYHQEQGDASDSKGSSAISDIIEFRQGEYDWFEDAQDLAVPENVFSRVGNLNETPKDNFYSLEGYVSDGKYLVSPYVDESVDQKYFKNKYRQLGESASIELLKNSSKTVSNIGSRFKSSISGIIINPKKDSINQNVLGTDSYAFAGLIRS